LQLWELPARSASAAARTLLDTGLTVRGCEIALADMKDAAALTAALSGVDGVFVMIPPIFDPTPGFPEARAIIAAVTTAIEVAKPSKVVCLSTIGAQATQPNLLNQLGLLEQALGALPSPVCFLRAASSSA
jgi:NAD(P)H dehydrogenase (quinone)